jgi:hypothetical protein
LNPRAATVVSDQHLWAQRPLGRVVVGGYLGVGGEGDQAAPVGLDHLDDLGGPGDQQLRAGDLVVETGSQNTDRCVQAGSVVGPGTPGVPSGVHGGDIREPRVGPWAKALG